jgi:hypothetical protein
VIAEAKQLEGLGRLLKAAGVKPAGTEQLIRDHLQEMYSDAKLQHAEIQAMVRALEEELVELRHSQALSVSEIRIATDLMRREVEVSNITLIPLLRAAKKALVLFAVLQLAVFAVLLYTVGRDMVRWPNLDLTMVAAEPTTQPAQQPSAPSK